MRLAFGLLALARQLMTVQVLVLDSGPTTTRVSGEDTNTTSDSPNVAVLFVL